MVPVAVLTDIGLMDGKNDVVHTGFFPTPLNAAAAHAVEELDGHALGVGRVGMMAAAVLAPGKRPLAVGKPDKTVDINHLHFSHGHLNECLLTETAPQYGLTLTGVLQPCGGCVQAKGVRA